VCRHTVSRGSAKPSETDAAVQHVDISGAEWARLYGGQPRNRRRNIDEINVVDYDPMSRFPNVVQMCNFHFFIFRFQEEKNCGFPELRLNGFYRNVVVVSNLQ
jgi:hypothetical protein